MANLQTMSCRVVVSESESSFEFKDLETHVSIQRKSARRMGVCTVRIFNLAKDNIDKLRQKGVTVLVYATVENVESLMFVGNITKTQSGYDGADHFIECFLSDGRVSLLQRVSVSYSKGERLQKILADLAGASGLNVGNISSPFDSLRLQSPFAFTGTIQGALNELTRTQSALWRVSNGSLLVGTDESLESRTARIYAPYTGLIGSPSASDGRKLDCQLVFSPEVNIGTVFKLESEEFDMFVRVQELTHTFGRSDDVWTTQVTVKRA